MICPECKGRTEVLETAQRSAGAITRRRRRCTQCGERFSTIETPVGHEKRDVKLGEVLSARKRRIEPEVLAAMLATDRRKARIARQQRERYDDEHAAPRSLRGDRLRRELKGY